MCKITESKQALDRLIEGNAEYVSGKVNPSSADPALREDTCKNGQHPYAVIVACADSRVIPESIFCAGIGELFVVRVAGNVVSEHLLASLEYAVDHLGCKLVAVVGHSGCGAVGAAIGGHAEGHVKLICDEIRRAIGCETDPVKASKLNVLRSVKLIRENFVNADVEIVGAMYSLESGKVEFLDN